MPLTHLVVRYQTAR